jgi:zinc protease
LLFTIQGGHRLSALEPSKAGIASLTASLMNEDTENYTAEQMSNELEKLGSSISVSSGPENYTVVVQSLKKNLDATLKLLEERYTGPNLPPMILIGSKTSNSKASPTRIHSLQL